MLIEVDLTGVPVLVVGLPDEIGSSVRRLERRGAVVSLAEDRVAALAAGPARLAVIVGAAREWAEVALIRDRCLVVEESTPRAPRGCVVLVGAGPGGAGLMTLDALRALADADVVLTDRLASVGDLSRLTPGAEVIDVGKRPGHHAVPQREIEALMVDRALRGLTVVRLKGGDPFVFGRGGEEVAAATSAGLPVSVVPGLTSAVAVPGSVGIPVTARDVSHVVTVISGHVQLSGVRARSLAGLGGTVVVLMGVRNLVPLTASLLAAGVPADTPAALVERGFTPDERSIVAPLANLADEARRLGAASPAVIVIGEVVRQSPAWGERATGEPARAEPAASPHPDTRPRSPSAGDQTQRHTESSVSLA